MAVRDDPAGPPLPAVRRPHSSPHPVLAAVLAELREREAADEPPAAYFEDSPDPDPVTAHHAAARQATHRTTRPRAAPRRRGRDASADGLRQFVLKVHSRCNLACTYCYVYQGPDQSWRGRPQRAGEETVRQTARRIAEHAEAHRLPSVRIDLHGGEPLLTGPGPAVAYADTVRAALPAGTTATVTVQTNGTLLTTRALDRLADAGIQVGISLDGGTAGLNARRVDHAGRPSWPAARRAAGLLATRRPGAYAGILCTVDPATDPGEVYGSLRALAPPSLDFLLPHLHWGDRPPGRHRPAPTPYGDWLAGAFDLWWNDTAPNRPRVRLFTEILLLLLGGSSRTDAVGLSPLTAVVVETDGTIERTDSLKTAFPGAPVTGLDVFGNSFDEALRHPRVAALRTGTHALGEECLRCPVLRVCGGGVYAHRYAPTTGHFRHPSAHCSDLERIVRHAAARMTEQLSISSRSLV